MSLATARLVTWGIISVCALALFSVFQPFWLPLYGAGCLMVVIGGLVFNLIPFATAQNPPWRLVKVLAIVLAILLFAVLIALGFVEVLL
jgi:hypothetical protein